MTPQRLFNEFLLLCPISDQCREGIKYQGIDPNKIKIKVPNRGTFIFTYHNEKKWRFEQV